MEAGLNQGWQMGFLLMHESLEGSKACVEFVDGRRHEQASRQEWRIGAQSKRRLMFGVER
jgi:hypothetical protein